MTESSPIPGRSLHRCRENAAWVGPDYELVYALRNPDARDSSFSHGGFSRACLRSWYILPHDFGFASKHHHSRSQDIELPHLPQHVRKPLHGLVLFGYDSVFILSESNAVPARASTRWHFRCHDESHQSPRGNRGGLEAGTIETENENLVTTESPRSFESVRAKSFRISETDTRRPLSRSRAIFTDVVSSKSRLCRSA
jgi:hypothetical protein